MPSVNVKGSDENIIEKVLVLQPNVSAEDLQTIQEYVVSATATRISDLEAQVDTLEPIIQNIDTSEANAKASEDNAKISEDNAEDYSLKSQSYAVGTNNTYRAGDATDNAEYYKNQCEAIASSLAGALRPMGTIAFANLPALSTADVGDMYNISDDFVTTSDFTVGAGISYPAGSNVYKIQSNKWDVLVGSAVVGVKGNAESNYRKGNVNITPANIGAVDENAFDSSIDSVYSVIGQNGAKNLISYPYDYSSRPILSGITYTINEDGSITMNGTSTNRVNYWLYDHGYGYMNLKSGDYILSKSGRTDVAHIVAFYKGSTWVKQVTAYEQDMTVSIDVNSDEYDNIGVAVSIGNAGVTVENVTVYPMLRLASDTDDTYQPYAMTNKQLTERKANISDVPTALSQLTADATHRLVTDTEKTSWNGKANSSTTLAGYGITNAYTKTEVDSALSNKAGAFVTQNFNNTSDFTVEANNYNAISIDITKQGYTPIAIVKIWATPQGMLPIGGYYIFNNNNVYSLVVRYLNPTSSSQTCSRRSLEFTVLYTKN